MLVKDSFVLVSYAIRGVMIISNETSPNPIIIYQICYGFHFPELNRLAQSLISEMVDSKININQDESLPFDDIRFTEMFSYLKNRICNFVCVKDCTVYDSRMTGDLIHHDVHVTAL